FLVRSSMMDSNSFTTTPFRSSLRLVPLFKVLIIFLQQPQVPHNPISELCLRHGCVSSASQPFFSFLFAFHLKHRLFKCFVYYVPSALSHGSTHLDSWGICV